MTRSYIMGVATVISIITIFLGALLPLERANAIVSADTYQPFSINFQGAQDFGIIATAGGINNDSLVQLQQPASTKDSASSPSTNGDDSLGGLLAGIMQQQQNRQGTAAETEPDTSGKKQQGGQSIQIPDIPVPGIDINTNNPGSTVEQQKKAEQPSTQEQQQQPPFSNESGLSLGSILTQPDQLSLGSASNADATKYEPAKINEVELNPPNDKENQWIEIYNPSDTEIDLANYKIKASFNSLTLSFPQDAKLLPHQFYTIGLDKPIMSNTAEALTLTDSNGTTVIDKTPSLIDSSKNENTWQRIPDGNSEWKFEPATKNKPNDHSTPDDGHATNINVQDNGVESGSIDCMGHAACIHGTTIRIVDSDTQYVKEGPNLYKVHLALVKGPTSSEQGFSAASVFTRDLCLGSEVVVDEDDGQTAGSSSLTSNSEPTALDSLLGSTLQDSQTPAKSSGASTSITGILYCSSYNINEELLNRGLATLDKSQCATSEFAKQSWAIKNGC